MTHSIPHQNPIPHFEDEHINITIDSDESKSFIHYIETELLDDESIEPSKELISFCKETLANFKVPKKVEFCELPKTSTGKIQKFELRKKAKEI